MESSLKKAVQNRILNEMLGSVGDGTGGGWKVLILDPLTTKILSSAVKMSDITDFNVSVVEDLKKDREPLPLAAVYFVQPSEENISRLLQDFEDVKPLYPSVYIFFSSPIRTKLLDIIKGCPPLLKVLKGLKETNLEYLLVDSRTIVTDIPLLQQQPHPLQSSLVRFMGPGADNRRRDSEMSVTVSRMATLFSTLKELPAIRYMLPPAPLPTDPPGAQRRSTLTQRMAAALCEKLDKMQQSGVLPSKETCDMIILDRSYDAVAPIIHEWTYEAMVHDLLTMDGSMYKYKADVTTTLPGKGPVTRTEEKEASIDERDPLWLELRHMFVAEVYAAIANRFKEFQAKNKAAKVAGSGIKDKASDMSLGSIRSLITALPQFHDILSRMSLHIQISSDLKAVTNERQMTDVGELEQDLVFGEKTSKELLAYLSENQQSMDTYDKVRLLMCYVATHPEKLDQAKRVEWMKLAGLRADAMDAICNMAYLGVQVMKLPDKGGSGFFGKKDKKEKKALRKPRVEEEGYALFRFEPLLKGILTDMQASKLSLEQYPYIRQPAADSDVARTSASGAANQGVSARTRQGGLNWAKRGQEGSGSSGTGAGGAGGRRLIVYIIGGAVRSEMRLVHQLSQQLGRDIILASDTIETPSSIVEQLICIGSEDAAHV